MSINYIRTVEELHQFVHQPGKRLLFKHSTSCPISARAHAEFQSFLKETDVSAAVVLVIEDRPVSNAIAEEFGIKHESPQVFLLEDGKVHWHASHWNITRESIRAALNQ